MQGKFLSNLLLLVFLNLLIKPFYILGIDAEVQNRVGEAAYGNYFALLNFSFLFNVLLDFGITNYNNRRVSRDASILKSEFAHIFGTKCLLIAIYAIVSVVVGLSLEFSASEWQVLAILLFNQVLVGFILYMRSNLGALQLFKRDSIISVLDRLILIVFCSILLWGNVTNQAFDIMWFVYGQTGAYFITLVMSFVLMPKSFQFTLPKLEISKSKELLRNSAPFALLTLLMMIYNRTDSVMLERMLSDGNSQAGYYAQGFRLLDAVNMFAMLFAVLLLPMFSKMIKDKEDVNQLGNLSYRLLMSFALPLAAICLFYSEEILALRYTNISAQAFESFAFLMVSFIGVATTYIYGTLLTANGSMRVLNIMAFGGIIVNLSLNFVLIPEYGAKGAAIATMITQLATGIFQLVYAQYMFKNSVINALLMPLGLYAILIFGGSYLMYDNMDWSLWQLPVFFTASLLLAWVLGNIQIKPFIEHLKAKR